MADEHSTRAMHEAASQAAEAAEHPAHNNPDETAPTTHPGGNGAHPASAADDAQARVQRAEQMVDQFAEKVGHYTSVLGRKLLRVGSRLREEAEDMWAEAQNIRRGGNP